MSTVETSIVTQQSLLEKVDVLAQELDISRSQLFVLAVEAYIQRHRNLRLLEAINSDAPEPEEQSLHRQMRQLHREIVQGQW